MTNQFEIYLKDDFLEMYLKPTYESRLGECGHGGHGHEHSQHGRDSSP